MGLNILIIGSGAREHAIARALDASNKEKNIFCIASNLNPGIAELCDELIIGDFNDPSFVVAYANEINADLVIIGPENPLARGISDALWNANIRVVGPKKDLAQIESSKAFTRDLLSKYNISGGPKYKTFSSILGVPEFLSELGKDYVVKFDGLAGGKGVKVSGDHLHSHREALDYCSEIITNKGTFVIEQKFVGEEFSLMSFCDGETLKHMPIVQDHKRAFENDTGPNTGGMGTYSDANHSLPFLNESDINEAKSINLKTAKALKEEFNEGYVGILYGGFIATKNGVKLIEYNARFGDPEAMNVLSILDSDFLEICDLMTKKKLKDINIKFKKRATVCKYAVPIGYPEEPVKDEPINLNKIENPDNLYYASVDIKNDILVESGSRTVAYVGTGSTIFSAEKIVEREISKVEGPLFHRSDIGKKELINKKIDHMKSIR
ncbi:phosphoribosylamine--glycine ligase [Candidatus Marinimicrobia bacterium]|nr:phosphoribosylamine--glycine ligase [Candidatus Neomarinimicrobiota bacterium]